MSAYARIQAARDAAIKTAKARVQKLEANERRAKDTILEAIAEARTVEARHALQQLEMFAADLTMALIEERVA